MQSNNIKKVQQTAKTFYCISPCCPLKCQNDALYRIAVNKLRIFKTSNAWRGFMNEDAKVVLLVYRGTGNR